MKYWYQKGFTIVEISIVLAVVSVLALITVAANNKVQNQAYDRSQKAKIVAIAAIFERYYDKYGEYPTGCSMSTSDLGCAANQSKVTTTAAAIYSNTSTASIATMPGMEDATSVLKSPNSPPLNGTYSNYGIFYWGQLGQYPNLGCGSGCSSGAGISGSNGSGMKCNSTDNIFKMAGDTPDSYSSFTLAYNSKDDGTWHIYQGKYGQRLKLNTSGYITAGTTIGKCVFET